MATMRRRVRCWHRGRHSGLPRCCVLWFVCVRLTLPKRVRHWTAEHRLTKDDRQYVACVLCRTIGRRVPLHMCDESCAGMRGECWSRKVAS